MINPLWTEVATYTKHRKGKLRDTYRIYVNSHGWVKGHSDKHGKAVIFKSLEEMQQKINSLLSIRFRLATGAPPTQVVPQYG